MKDVARLQAALRAYPWSSYRAMIGLVAKEEWLVTKDTLARWGTTVREQQTNYAGFVEQGLIGDLANPAEEAKAQSILGHDRFIDRIRRIVQKRRPGDRESERARRQVTAESIESVVSRVARAYKIPREAMMKAGKGRGGNEARQVAMWLARERCGAHATLRNMGKAMGGIGRSRFPWHATGSHAAPRETSISEEYRRGCHDMW